MRVLDPDGLLPHRQMRRHFSWPNYITERDIDACIADAMAPSATAPNLPKAEGVYLSRNSITGTIYVGRSTKMRERVGIHLSQLRNGKHLNTAMQADAIKYGADVFRFSVLTLTKPKWTWITEASAIRAIKDRPNYNIVGVDYMGRANFTHGRTTSRT